PSILSMFEDAPTIETKGLDEESEATLLTALTEILDNVDDENLSPFDTLPDADLLSGQKGREHSPVSLRRLMCLSRSPPEKDAFCNTRSLSTGKVGFCTLKWNSIPRILADSLQRSDGEEEEDGSFTLSPVSHDSSPDGDLLDWKSLTLPLPITLEQEDDGGIPVCLGDLVRHMHPYCMTFCVENDVGEQMLPEGGILLEVVDQGENGEPILAIPDMDLPASLALKEQKDSEEAEEVASDTSEHIVVDDEDVTVTEYPVKDATPVTPGIKDEMIVRRQKEEIKEKSPSKRKKKKSKEQPQSKPVEGRVLRSGRLRNTTQELPKKLEKKMVKEVKKQRIPKVPPAPTQTSSSKEPKKLNACQTEVATTKPLPVLKIRVATSEVSQKREPEKNQPKSSPAVLSSKQPEEMPEQPAKTPEKPEDSSVAPSAVVPPVPAESSTAAPGVAAHPMTPPVSEAPAPVAPAVPEPKPKSLSLAEYRRLRQQKKPAPVEKQDDNSTKWPSLPELPKELPLIPCLPDPSPKDPRRPNVQAAKKEVEEVRPAWQPRGPCAPPTPEALLVPPAYMVASSNKASAAPSVSKPRQTADEPKPSPPQNPSPPAAISVKNVSAQPQSTAHPAALCAPRTSESPASPPDAKCLPALSKGHCGVAERPTSQPAEVTKTSPKTTTEVMKPIAATVPAPRKITVVFPKVPVVTAPPSIKSSPSSVSMATKPTADGTKLCSSPANHPSEPRSLKISKPVVLENKEKPTTALKPQSAKSSTQELIEAFTSEIDIYESPSASALTPPATPPHQMWKPLVPVALLGKSKAAEASKSSPSKVIQIEARPLPSVRSRSKPTPAAAAVSPEVACMDHDYCLPNKGASNGEAGKRWNVKQQSFITIKPITTQTPPAVPVSSARANTNAVAASKPQDLTRTEYRSRHRDRSSSSSSRSSSGSSPSVSRSPPRRRRYSYSSSRSGSWSRSRSRSRSPQRQAQWNRSRRLHRYRESLNVFKCDLRDGRLFFSQEERRVVYVGRIRGTMTQKELQERFSLFGEIEECTLHFRDHGDNYGFVTYYDTKDAFTAIENGSKLRKPDELPFDLCFGGRRQFCQTSYADLDSNREYDPYQGKVKCQTLDFDTLLKQAQQNLKR
uniref:PPARG related coactivator 1 n=1 Tax=Labrus bergylta TaxID=56723 RepID=A0A3Q3MJZ4_9LABR